MQDSTDGQQLAILGEEPEPKRGARLCSPGLRRLVADDGNDGRGAIRLISINPTLRAEAERLLPVFEAAAGAKPHPDPDTHEDLLSELLVIHAAPLGVKQHGPEGWANMWDVYLDTLMDTPVEWVRGAFDRWHHGLAYPTNKERHAFYPRPAELVAQAEAYHREIVMAAYRCRKALEWKEAPTPMTQEQRKAERDAAIAEGLLTPDGRPNLSLKGFEEPSRPAQSPQEVAARIRGQADEVGDVI